MSCSSSDEFPPRLVLALSAVGLLLADRFPEVALPSLRRVARSKPKKTAPKAGRKPREPGAKRCAAPGVIVGEVLVEPWTEVRVTEE